MFLDILLCAPACIVGVATIVIGLYPRAITRLEHRPSRRVIICVPLIALTIASAASTVFTMHQSDVATEGLRSDMRSNVSSGMHQESASFQQFVMKHVPLAPRYGMHIVGVQYKPIAMASGWTLAFYVSVQNDGDDAVYSQLTKITAVFETPKSIAGVEQITDRFKRELRADENGSFPRTHLISSGEVRTIAIMRPNATYGQIEALKAGMGMIWFGFHLDVRTASGKKGALDDCGIYAGLMPIDCT